MKQQVKLTESELFNVIEGAVKSLVMEYGTAPGKKGEENRSKMAKVASRNLRRGDDSAYHNAVNSITKGGGTKKDLSDFNDKFEKEELNSQPINNIAANESKQYKVNESQLKDIIKESVMSILKEIGETDKGQEWLGGIAARKSFGGNYDDYSYVSDYAKNKRNGDMKKSDKYARAFHNEKDRLKNK